MSTPVHQLRPAREPGTERTAGPDHVPPPTPLVDVVPISGLLGSGPRAAAHDASDANSRAARNRAATVRRMSFSREQLKDKSSVASADAIAAVAKQTGIIDTKKLAAADRISLLRVLKADTQFPIMHRPLLLELADEVRADLGATKSPAASAAPVALTYGNVNVTASSETFDSQAEADKNWATRAKSAGVTSHQVIGNFPDLTRLSLDYGLFRYTSAERLGSELRLMIPVRVGATTSQLPVVMTWDGKGAATVRLAGKSAPRPPTTRSPEVFAKYLAAKGVTVADVRSWNAQQLQEFVVAVQLIDKLDPKAVRALQGIVLEYTTKADTSGGDPQEALFSWDTQNKKKTTLLVRKQAFTEDAKRFVGSPGEQLHCHSTMTLAHELGHAVEDHHHRVVSHAQAAAVSAQAAAFADYGRANDDYVKKTQSANAVIFSKYESARVAAVANALASLYEVAENAINAAVEGLDVVTKRGQLPTLRRADIDNAQQLLVDAAQLFAEEAKKNPTLSADSRPLLVELTAGQKRLSATLEALDSAAESVRKMNAKLETVVHREGKEVRSKRLQNFIIFVKKLSPDSRERVIGITPYARKEWTKKPRELFAEAYALWLTDKSFLTRVAPEFVEYFGQGMHLK